MNSILQCLSNTKELRDYCLQNQYLRDLNNNSRMRTALMSGNRQSPAPGSKPSRASVPPVPAACPSSPGPPCVLGDPHPGVGAAPQPCWGRHCAVGTQPAEGPGPKGTLERSADLSSGGHDDDMSPGLPGDSCVTDLPLSTEFAKLIQLLWTSSPNESVSPSEFKTQIQRYAPRFVGYK